MISSGFFRLLVRGLLIPAKVSYNKALLIFHLKNEHLKKLNIEE